MSVNTRKVIKLEPPDGGWGWMVVLGAALNNGVNVPLVTSLSLIYGDALEDMGYKTQGAALILGTLLFVSHFGGPIAGAMVKLTSPRIVAVMGSCFCAAGIFISGFSTSIWHLVFSYGVLTGMGFNLTENSIFVTINSYFKQKKSRAVGLAYVGASFGNILVPHLVRYLLDEYGFRGACLLLSSLSLHGVVGTLLFQSVECHMKSINIEVPVHELQQNECKDTNENIFNKKIIQADVNKHNKNMQLSEHDLPKKDLDSRENKTFNSGNVNDVIVNKPDIASQHATTTINAIAVKKASLLKTLYDLLDISLLTDFRFNNIIIGLALINTSTTNFALIFPLFLQKVASLDKQQTANCMSAAAAADLVGRLTIPVLQDKYKVPARWGLIISCTWLIIFREIFAYQTDVRLLLFISIMCSCGRSMTMVSKNIAISENCKLEQVPAAVGLGMLTSGIISPPGGYFLGWIRDYTNSYIACITAQNAILVIVLVMWIPDVLYLCIKERKEHKKDTNTIS